MPAPPPAPDPYLELLKRCLTADLYDESAWSVLTGWRSGHGGWQQRVRQAVVRLLDRRGLAIVRKRAFDASSRAAGTDWPAFGYSMIGLVRMNNIEACVRVVLSDGIPGDFIETGVWRGGSAIFMRALLRHFGIMDRRVWVADSFEGLPKPSHAHDVADRKWDMSENSYLAASLEQVQANFARFELLDDQVRFLKGWFRDSLPNAPIARLSILRMDGDMYESTLDALQALYGRVSPGGFVIVDDYSSWPACRLAVDEFRAHHNVSAELTPVAGGAVFWRVPLHEPLAARTPKEGTNS